MPRRGQAQSKGHPWAKRVDASCDRLRVEGKLPPLAATPKPTKRVTEMRGWTCPSCGSPTCCFGECAENDY